MTRKPTQAQRWLDAGHRYDDLDLWRELCELLDTRGALRTADLPNHLAPLAFRDPENTYQGWLREHHLLPIIHLSIAGEQGKRWRVHRDWRARLAVMSNPTSANLLQWWRELEPVMRAQCLKRTDRVNVSIFDPTAAGCYRLVATPRYHCTLCKGESWSDDPRGVLHVWRGAHGFPDCPLLRLRMQIRVAEQRERPDEPMTQLSQRLRRVAQPFIGAAPKSRAAFWQELAEGRWQEARKSETYGRLAWAAAHIAQTCVVWIEPTPESVHEYARYLRGEGDWPHAEDAESQAYQQRVVGLYIRAADALARILT